MPQLVESEMFIEISIHKLRESRRDRVRQYVRNIPSFLDRFTHKQRHSDGTGAFIGLRCQNLKFAVRMPDHVVLYGYDPGFNIDILNFHSTYFTTPEHTKCGQHDRDLKLLSLFMNDVDEEGNPEYTIDEIYSYGTLESYRPLMVELTFYGDMPSYGVSYTDENGETRYFAVSVSGYDGSLELLEF